MSRRLLVLVPVVTVLMAGPAWADQAKSVTATGTAAVKVVPKDRNSDASIAAAVEAAQVASIPGAMAQAREYALRYAQAAGLTLGAVVSVSDAQNGGYGGGPFGGPFGPNQFCGIVPQPIFKVVKHRRKQVGTKQVRRCFVPRFASATLTVTYSAT
jgi:hypothetical protein